MQEGFDWYGPAPIPDVRDSVVAEFLDRVQAGDPAAQAELTAGPSDRGKSVLRTYAERMASLAVRRGDAGPLVPALVALVAGGLDRGEREALMVMSLIDHSAGLLGVDLPDIFGRAAAAGTMSAEAQQGLTAWLARSPADRLPAAMGFAVSSDASGFRYRHGA